MLPFVTEVILINRYKLFKGHLSGNIINNYYNVQPPYYSNPSYYSELESNQMDNISKMLSIMFVGNCYIFFACLSSTMKQLLEKFNFELLHSFNFSCT